MNFMLFSLLLAEWQVLLAEWQPRPPLQEPFPSADQIWAVGAVCFALWLFAVGASVGSFLNVVVYRLPAGLNLSSPGSRCPRCLHPIRLRHNIPILGWLMLRGRCADCHLPIATRYPLVELLIGMIFLVVGGVELLGNGWNLPISGQTDIRQALSTNEPWSLGAAVLLHLVLLATLVSAALIDYDGHPIPQRIVLPIIFAAVLVSLWWPVVHPLPAVHSSLWVDLQLDLFMRGWRAGLVDVVAGALAGVAACWLIYSATWFRPWLARRYGGPLLLLWMAIGMVCGWQLIPWLLACWAVRYSLSSARGGDLNKHPLLPALGLIIVLLISLLLWRFVALIPLVLDERIVAQAAIYGALLVAAWVLLNATAQALPVDYDFPEPAVSASTTVESAAQSAAETVPPPSAPLSSDEPTP